MADQNNAEFMPVNTRSPEQWKILSREYDFEGKEVLDVGCGHGDLLLFAQQAGALVFGVDNDREIAYGTERRGLPILFMDLEYYLKTTTVHYDVVFCFSVLPYVKNMKRTLDGLACIADAAFVECQLKDDGPGTLTEKELEATLGEYWDSVKKIGFSKVLIRNTERPIWMCGHDS